MKKEEILDMLSKGLENLSVRELEEFIAVTSYYYYYDTPLVPDEVWDYAYNILLQKHPNSPYLRFPYGAYPPDKQPLRPASIFEIVRKYYRQLPALSTLPIKVLPKLDGSAVILQYQSGRLVRALTRGGLVRTANVWHAIPKHIPYDGYVEIRGEAVVPKDSDLSGYATYQHKANSLLVRKYVTDDVRQLRVIVWAITVADLTVNSIEDSLALLKDWGFATPPVFEVSSMEDVDRALSEYEYACDGVVWYPQVSKVGDEIFYNPVAIYVRSPEALSVVRAIEFNRGKTKFGIQLIIDPVSLDGRTIRKVTGHSARWVMENQAGIGSVIAVKLANGKIPVASRVLVPSSNIPVPVCNEHNREAVIAGSNWVCPECHKQDG